MYKFLGCLLVVIIAVDACAQGSAKPQKPEMITKDDPRADTADKAFVIDNQPEPLESLQALVLYPEEAKRSGLEGKVVISALIDTNGAVLKVRIEQSDFEIFEEPARQALLRARFTPAYQKGKPIKIWYTVPISFRLSQE